MKSERDGINPSAKPSGTGCVECLATGGWWLHLRRCAECGHIGCCDNSPSQHGRILCRFEIAPAAFAPIRSTGARTSRTSACKLAKAAARIAKSPGVSLTALCGKHAVDLGHDGGSLAHGRLVDPDLTSPIAKTPTRLVSSGSAG